MKNETTRHYVIRVHVSTTKTRAEMMAEFTEVMNEEIGDRDQFAVVDVEPCPLQIVNDPHASVFADSAE